MGVVDNEVDGGNGSVRVGRRVQRRDRGRMEAGGGGQRDKRRDDLHTSGNTCLTTTAIERTLNPDITMAELMQMSRGRDRRPKEAHLHSVCRCKSSIAIGASLLLQGLRDGVEKLILREVAVPVPQGT